MCDEFIAVGRRSLLCGEITKAVESFQKACENIAAEHGDLDERLAEPNLLYGTALLELARMEGPVLGNALDGGKKNELEYHLLVPEEDDSDENDIIEKGPEMTSDEKEDLSNQVIDAMCEESKEESDEQNKEQVEESENTEKVGDEEVAEEDEVASSDNEEETPVEEDPVDAEESPSVEDVEKQCDEKPDKGEGESDVDSEDVSNLQVAWEVIEVAKQIFSRSESKENKLKVADCLEKLAEISREKEDYEQAIMDLQECMSIRSSLLASESREVAETHFQIGTTHAVSGKLESAGLAFHSALKCLKDFSAKLQQQLDEVKEGGEEEAETLRATLKDIDELIPDVERRCVEVEEDLSASVADAKISPPTTTKKENVAPGDDISHLIRKKRPVTEGKESKETGETKTAPESNGAESAPVNKKAKLEGDDLNEVKANGDEVNGNSKVDTVCH